MAGVEVKSFEKADEINDNFNNAKIEAVKVGNQRVMKLTLQPGWKWSKDIKPTVGGDSCQATHLGVIVSGAVCAKHNDGTEITYKAGDAYSIQPGHDGWVVGMNQLLFTSSTECGENNVNNRKNDKSN